MRSRDVGTVVIGAGPAGSATALTLARLGHEVLVVDKHPFPRYKPCGDGVGRESVRELARLGLDSLVEAATRINGIQMIGADGKPLAAYDFDEHSTRPACISRYELDFALLNEAIARGADFVVGRLESLDRASGYVTSVTLQLPDGDRLRVTASRFVAADGATSRMRRLIQPGRARPPMRAYAIREYMHMREATDNQFRIFVPARLGERVLPGYGWVFPVADHVLNVGVGYFRDFQDDSFAEVSLLHAHEQFVQRLFEQSATGLGTLERRSRPAGALLGIGLMEPAPTIGNVIFVGDAAELTDPLNGEGIASALKSGRIAAEAIDQGLHARRGVDFERRIRFEFSYLGQDTSVIMRDFPQFVEQAGLSANGTGPAVLAEHPLIKRVVDVMANGDAKELGIRQTPVYNTVLEGDTELQSRLEATYDMALTAVRSRFPFAHDLLRRRFLSGLGPTAATVALVTASSSPQRRDVNRSIQAALAIELLSHVTPFLLMLPEQQLGEHPNLGNGLATLTADHVLSQSIAAIAPLGAKEVSRLSRTLAQVCVGAAMEAEYRFDACPTPTHYMNTVKENEGSVYAHAAALGARLAGATDNEHICASYGRSLGMALRICQDVTELVAGDLVTASSRGFDLMRGVVSLPVSLAITARPSLAGRLGKIGLSEDLDELIREIRSTDAVDRAVAECKRHADQASRLLDDAGSRREELVDLAQLVASQCMAAGSR